MAKTQFGQDTQQQNAMAQRQRADKNKWEELLAMLNFAHKGDPQTMLGFGLGRLLRDGFNTWMKNYRDRGDAKDRKAYEDYTNLTALGGYNGSFDDFKKNVWEPRYQANRKMIQSDAKAQAELQGNASDGKPIMEAASPTAVESRGKGVGEYAPVNEVNPAGSAKDYSAPENILGQWNGRRTPEYFVADPSGSALEQWAKENFGMMQGDPFVGGGSYGRKYFK